MDIYKNIEKMTLKNYVKLYAEARRGEETVKIVSKVEIKF